MLSHPHSSNMNSLVQIQLSMTKPNSPDFNVPIDTVISCFRQIDHSNASNLEKCRRILHHIIIFYVKRECVKSTIAVAKLFLECIPSNHSADEVVYKSTVVVLNNFLCSSLKNESSLKSENDIVALVKINLKFLVISLKFKPKETGNKIMLLCLQLFKLKMSPEITCETCLKFFVSCFLTSSADNSQSEPTVLLFFQTLNFHAVNILSFGKFCKLFKRSLNLLKSCSLQKDLLNAVVHVETIVCQCLVLLEKSNKKACTELAAAIDAFSKTPICESTPRLCTMLCIFFLPLAKQCKDSGNIKFLTEMSSTEKASFVYLFKRLFEILSNSEDNECKSKISILYNALHKFAILHISLGKASDPPFIEKCLELYELAPEKPEELYKKATWHHYDLILALQTNNASSLAYKSAKFLCEKVISRGQSGIELDFAFNMSFGLSLLVMAQCCYTLKKYEEAQRYLAIVIFTEKRQRRNAINCWLRNKYQFESKNKEDACLTLHRLLIRERNTLKEMLGGKKLLLHDVPEMMLMELKEHASMWSSFTVMREVAYDIFSQTEDPVQRAQTYVALLLFKSEILREEKLASRLDSTLSQLEKRGEKLYVSFLLCVKYHLEMARIAEDNQESIEKLESRAGRLDANVGDAIAASKAASVEYNFRLHQNLSKSLEIWRGVPELKQDDEENSFALVVRHAANEFERQLMLAEAIEAWLMAYRIYAKRKDSKNTLLIACRILEHISQESPPMRELMEVGNEIAAAIDLEELRNEWNISKGIYYFHNGLLNEAGACLDDECSTKDPILEAKKAYLMMCVHDSSRCCDKIVRHSNYLTNALAAVRALYNLYKTEVNSERISTIHCLQFRICHHLTWIFLQLRLQREVRCYATTMMKNAEIFCSPLQFASSLSLLTSLDLFSFRFDKCRSKLDTLSHCLNTVVTTDEADIAASLRQMQISPTARLPRRPDFCSHASSCACFCCRSPRFTACFLQYLVLEAELCTANNDLASAEKIFSVVDDVFAWMARRLKKAGRSGYAFVLEEPDFERNLRDFAYFRLCIRKENYEAAKEVMEKLLAGCSSRHFMHNRMAEEAKEVLLHLKCVQLLEPGVKFKKPSQIPIACSLGPSTPLPTVLITPSKPPTKFEIYSEPTNEKKPRGRPRKRLDLNEKK